ncbi:MAG: type II secretion system protein [Peptoniphilus sp.]|nr:type II secretion system protein [Peptoniphilus sp.]MDD7363848.1 type II secretion system protein [Bacillota bacterium]MDY6044313.1 type II secretion system protein [Peptoniphilus sp.]
MKKMERRRLSSFARKRAFTLLELVLSLAIASVLIVLLSQMLASALGGTLGLGRRISGDNDGIFAMESMVDDIQKADEIYRIEPNYIQFYEREKGPEGHKVVSYLIEDGKMCRYGDHYRLKYDPKRIKRRPGVKNVVLADAESLEFREAGGALSVELRSGHRTYRRVIALRGRYE